MNIHMLNNISDLEISLLGFLTDKPMHGYELHRKVTNLEGFGIIWHLKIGKLYSMLNKLLENHLVEVENHQEGNRPVRNEYRITMKGEEVFQQWVVTPVLHGRDFRQHFLLKLYFSLYRDEERLLQLINDQQNECESWKKRFDRNLSSLENGNESQYSFQIFVNHYRLSQVKADLEWLSWTAKKICEEK
jgi:DNA-binding PadR family transcriptional regulator